MAATNGKKKSGKGLGRGLDALISNKLDVQIEDDALKSAAASGEGVVTVRLSEVEPDRSQPRSVFDDKALCELAESLKIHGMIQPIIVKKLGDTYRIIAGERRWRAARLAGLTEIPVLIRDYTEQEAAEVALIENIQRKDLNAIEEAVAFQKLINEYSLKQEVINLR